MLMRLLIALSLISLLAQGVISEGVSPSSSTLSSHLVTRSSASTALKSEFSDIHDEIRKAREPLARACKANDVRSVVSTFEDFQKSFQGLANSCSKTYNKNRKSPSQFAHGFITILVEFQPLLKTLQPHPALLRACLTSFRGSSTSINTMISFLKAGKVDLKSEVHNAGAGLDLHLFAQCGFKINLSS